jgi:hypothetical protein
VLALWGVGMVLARSCALTAVSHLLAKGMHRQEQTVRQQLRAWYYEVPRKPLRVIRPGPPFFPGCRLPGREHWDLGRRTSVRVLPRRGILKAMMI